MLSTYNTPPRLEESEEELEKAVIETAPSGFDFAVISSAESSEQAGWFSCGSVRFVREPEPLYRAWGKSKSRVELPILVQAENVTASGGFEPTLPTFLSYLVEYLPEARKLSPERRVLLEKIRQIRRSIGPVSTNCGELLRELNENGE